MNDNHETQVKQQHSDRRRFLGCFGGLLSSRNISRGRFSSTRGLSRRADKSTAKQNKPEEIIALMKQGNERFRKGENLTAQLHRAERATSQ